MKVLGLAVAVVTVVALWMGIADFPPWADPEQPAAVHVSPRYIQRALEETGVPNVVTAVLADYRGYDTMFETVVIFTAGVAVIMLLRRSRG